MSKLFFRISSYCALTLLAGVIFTTITDSVSAYALINFDSKANASNDNNASVNSSVNAKTEVRVEDKTNIEDNEDNKDNDVNDDSRSKTSADNSINATVDSRGEDDDVSIKAININRGQIRAEAERNNGIGNDDVVLEDRFTTGGQQVITSDDLRAFASSTMRADESVDEINFTDESVEIHYMQKGRFLALLPIKLNVKVIVHADGTMEVRYPWYSILTVDNKNETETRLKVAVDNRLHGGTVGSVRAEGQAVRPTLSASVAAQIALDIQAILKGILIASNSSVATSSPR